MSNVLENKIQGHKSQKKAVLENSKYLKLEYVLYRLTLARFWQ